MDDISNEEKQIILEMGTPVPPTPKAEEVGPKDIDDGEPIVWGDDEEDEDVVDPDAIGLQALSDGESDE